MMSRFSHLLAALALMMLLPSAQAVLSCTSPVSTGISTAYNPGQASANITQGMVTFNCTRTVAGDPTSVLLANNLGANPSGSIMRAALGGSFIQYDLYKTSGCVGQWSNTVPTTITAPLLNITGSQPVSASYWGCITLAGQAVPAGTYIDTVVIGLFNPTTLAAISPQPSFTVSIVNPATCAAPTLSNIVFSTPYIAFGSAMTSPAVIVTINCTPKLPYTMAISPNSVVLNGLLYSFNTNWVQPPGAGSQLVGTGPGQLYTISATIAAGQSGQCGASSCTATSPPHTLTVTY